MKSVAQGRTDRASLDATHLSCRRDMSVVLIEGALLWLTINVYHEARGEDALH